MISVYKSVHFLILCPLSGGVAMETCTSSQSEECMDTSEAPAAVPTPAADAGSSQELAGQQPASQAGSAASLEDVMPPGAKAKVSPAMQAQLRQLKVRQASSSFTLVSCFEMV